MTALLPCPFCGAPGESWSTSTGHYARCMDEECNGSEIRPSDSLDEAIAAWNRRTPPPLPTREEVADAIFANFHDACMEAPRCTQPGCKCSMDAADAVLRLLGGEKTDA